MYKQASDCWSSLCSPALALSITHSIYDHDDAQYHCMSSQANLLHMSVQMSWQRAVSSVRVATSLQSFCCFHLSKLLNTRSCSGLCES